MNNEQLDHELRQLFEPDRRSIDPKGAAATALFESITSETEQTPSVPSFEANVISLTEPTPRPNRGRILLVAAAILLALLGIGRWLLPSTEEAPVISEDVESFDVNGSAEIVPDGFIEGPAVPIVLINHSELRTELILSCAPAAFDGHIEPKFEGSAVLGVVSGSGGENRPFSDTPTPNFAVVADVVNTSMCEFSNEGASSASVLGLDSSWEPNPVVIEWGSSGFIGDAGLTVGRLTEDVSEVRLIGVPSDSQAFQRFGEGWFRLDFEAQLDADLEVVFNDGETIPVTVSQQQFSTQGERCGSAACVAESFESLRDEAMEAGALRQAAFLESGVLSQAEYDAAEGSFMVCVEALIDSDSATTILEAGSDDAEAAQACYDEEISFLERARLQQNGIAEFAELDREVAEAIADIDPLITEARQLFDGGLSRDELQELWDGYPYGTDERDARIDRYLTDFAWMREGIVVEVSLFEQFAGTGNFQPIVSAQSLQDRNLAAAFVLGVVDEQVVIRRLPEAPTRTFSTYDSSSDTVSTSLRGVEGGVTAFLEGVELEALPDDDGGGTTFLLPSDYQWESVVTIVGASPEEPGAEAVVLN